MIKLRWPDGEFTTGESWGEVLDAIRQNQWATPRGRLAFRLTMARRAVRWSGKRVPIRTTVFGSDAAFGRALATAGLYSVAREDGRSSPHGKEIA